MTLQLTGAEPEAALHSEAQAVAAALQGNTLCISGEPQALSQNLHGCGIALPPEMSTFGLSVSCGSLNAPRGHFRAAGPDRRLLSPPRPRAAVDCLKIFADRMQCSLDSAAQVGVGAGRAAYRG